MLNRYADSKILTEYDLCVDLFNRFDLKVYDVIPVRTVFIAATDKGTKVLKKLEYTCKELKFIHNVTKYIKNKFPRIIDFVEDKDKEIYTVWNGDVYCVMDMVEGKECDFSSPVDLGIASKGLAEMHLASEGFKTNFYTKYNNGKLIDAFKRKAQEMEFFKNIASIHENKNEFDLLFLSNVDFYIKQILKSVEMLEQSYYYKLCSEEDKRVVCHHDLAHHNILIHDNEAYFIDFDYAIIDLKVHDLCNFINKVIKNFDFDIEKAELILKNYDEKNSLSNRELEVLNAMLTFPDDFYTISKDYYTKRKDWDEQIFIDRLNRKVAYKEDREEFLTLFKKNIL